MQPKDRAIPEVMARTLFFTVFLFLLFSCGVKVLPLANENTTTPMAPNLDCSPLDPNCDRTDPNYRPR